MKTQNSLTRCDGHMGEVPVSEIVWTVHDHVNNDTMRFCAACVRDMVKALEGHAAHPAKEGDNG